VVVDDLRGEKRFAPSRFLLEHGVMSGISTLICGERGALGVLSLHSTKRRSFSPDEQHFLQAVANVIAAGVERRQAEEARGRLIAILDATPDLVAITGKDQRLSYLNRAGREMLGLRPEEDVSARSLRDFRPYGASPSAFEEGMRTALARGVWRGESALLQRASQKQIPVSQVIIAHRSPDGSLEFLSTIASDISERQRLEEQFRQSQKMEAIGKLAGGVAHDFNNLLCVITGFSEILLGRLPEDGPLRGFAQEIDKAAGRATSLTRQLLAFSRKQMLAPQTLNLNALVADMDKMLRRLIGEDVELVTALDPTLAPIRADPGQVEQILMNLAVNSRDAMPQGGTLTLSTRNAVLDGPALREQPEVRPGSYVLLEVSDTGVGMDAGTRNRIFEPFFTTKEAGKGTGLGLATVYGIVKQSGGHIEVQSERGRGATFKIFLPRCEERSSSSEAASGAGESTGGTETVLLAEDEDGVRSLARQTLEEKGYHVLEACNGEEALELCERYPRDIHLLLTDAVMPKLSGGELAQRVRQLRPATKVLFMSGFTDSALIRHGVWSGVVDCLLKPFSPEALASAVRSALDSNPEGQALPAHRAR
jgi:PAS domain S-box-containing protein